MDQTYAYTLSKSLKFSLNWEKTPLAEKDLTLIPKNSGLIEVL